MWYYYSDLFYSYEFMPTEEKDVLDTIDSSNIFDEFETWELKEEFRESQQKEKKGVYDYLSVIAWFMSILFWTGLFASLIALAYIKVQENEDLTSSSILNPICTLFSWWVETPNVNCWSISYLSSHYSQTLEELKSSQFESSLEIIEQAYKIENFIQSKEVVFLDTLTKKKVRPLEILNSFDRIKYNYDPTQTERIKCKNIVINQDNILSAQCDAFTSHYAKDIKWFNGIDWANIWGTSITLASSFLYYLENNASDFILLEKPKSFSIENVYFEYSDITKKTSFDLKLQYVWSELNNK